MAGLLGRHFPQVGIVLVQEDERAAVRAEPVVELPFRGLDALEGAEAQQVCAAHVGDQAVVRLADFHELGDVVGMVGTHLDHGHLRVGGDGQQRERHADIIVEIALRGRDAVFLRQHGGDEVLGGGLAVRARQAEHGQFAVPHVRAVPDGQLLQGLERVRNADQTRFASPLIVIPGLTRNLCILVHHRPGGAGFQRLERVVVPVEILSPEGEEDLSAADRPAVGRDLAAAG